MSSTCYFVCTEHDPYIKSDEITSHLGNYAYVDALKAANERPVGDPDWDQSYDYFAANAKRFLTDHPRCRLIIKSEYGELRDLDDKPLTGPFGEPLIDPFSHKALMKQWDERFVMLTFLELGSGHKDV